jgi:hypothetical protein
MGSVLGIAGIVLVHNLMAMVFVGILVAWMGWLEIGEWRMENGDSTPRTTHHTSRLTFYVLRFKLPLAFALGIGLAAFFWLPVALESNAVNLGTLIGEGDNFDFRTHFLSLWTLLSPTGRLDWGATETGFVFNLGLAQWVLGLVGGWFVVKKWLAGEKRWHELFFVVATLGLLFLMMPASLFLWESIPLLPFLQFPWRLLGSAVAMLAILSGIGAGEIWQQLELRDWRLGRFNLQSPISNLTILLILIILPSLPLTQVPPWSPDFGATDTRRITEIELEGRWLGTTSTGDFVPASVAVLPKPEGSVLRGLLDNGVVDRVNRAALPEGAVVEFEPIKPLHTRFHVESSVPFAFRLFLFAFPGWEVQVDGQIVDTEIGLPEGFIVVPMEAGVHVVDVEFKDTGVRRNAGILSIISLLSTAALFFLYSHNEKENHAPRATHHASQTIIPLLIFTLIYILILNPTGILHVESKDLVAIPADYHTLSSYNNEIALIGFDIPKHIRAGENIELTLYWQALQLQEENYRVFSHFLNENGVPVAQSDKLNPGDFPTERWGLEKYIQDTHRMEMPANLPPGTYKLTAGLWLAETGERLFVTEAGQIVGEFKVLQEYKIGD